MMSRLTQTQGKRLCELAHLLRPEWDIPGIESAVRAAADLAPGVEVARALLALVANPEILTPGMLPKPGRHWPVGDDGTSVLPTSHNVRCLEHPLSFHPCPQCEAKRCEPTEDYLLAKRSLPKLARAAGPKSKPLPEVDTAAIARKKIDERGTP